MNCTNNFSLALSKKFSLACLHLGLAGCVSNGAGVVWRQDKHATSAKSERRHLIIPDKWWYPEYGEGMPWSSSPLLSVALLVNTSTVWFGVNPAELSRIQSRLLSAVGFCSLISKSKNSHLSASGEIPAEVPCAAGLGELSPPDSSGGLGAKTSPGPAPHLHEAR